MEMGRRDMRRGGTNRFPKKQSGSGVSAKSKKRLLKKQEMVSYDDDFSPSDLEIKVARKKSKFPKKNLKDSNGVDHASVPRKLRSAMKKRNIESVSKLSSGSKRLNRSKTGIESSEDLMIKKENQEMEAKAMVPESMMISKDEKEVAETLYGLADMFTETSSSVDKKTRDPLPDDKETTKVDSILVLETDSPKPEPAVSVLSSAKTDQIDDKPLQQDHNQNRMVDFLDRLKQSSSVNVTDAPVRAIETKVATCGNGLALWPGLSSTAPQVLSKPSSTKLPPWMGQAVSPSKNASSLVTEQPLRVQPRKLKKCASHIYISRLIKVLQTSSNQKEQRSSETSQPKLPDPVTTTISDFKSMASPSKKYQNPHLLDLHKAQNPKPAQEDMTKLALDLYGPQASHKQSYDFLSLSSNGAAQSQSHFSIPNSFPHYNSQLSPSTSSHQVQQISPYLASRYQTAYNANQQQQQQLQKRIWAAQYRPQTSRNTVPPPSSSQYSSSKPNLSLNMTSIQPLHVASSPRYSNNSMSHQQQHRLMAAAAAMSMNHHHHHHHNSNNPSRTIVMNRQEHHFPLVYEDTRTSMQLLCNEKS
ncbi:unnamed protein product [Microthlaspi erraticum]|uniref:Uncharacterized protein n=1 Tax=Microthlaspi erraticum TaxID=1685480 RepID=A0A6D2JLG0_9BRAS|nr:unnamed protein product [Microthlaspi erraticum]